MAAGEDHEPAIWRFLLARFRLPLALMVAITAIGTIGYQIVEGWPPLDALYMTAITLTTVGYSEVQPLTMAGRIFTIGLMFTGVVAVFAAIAVTAQLLVSGELGEPLRRRRMRKRIEQLSDHYVICAYGRVGRATADEFRQQEVPFVVVEPQVELASLMEEHGVPFLTADPTEEAVLKQAGIERAKGLVCAVDSDAINVYITLTGRVLNPELSIVARAASPESVDQLHRAGADRVISPYVLSGQRMASLALHPAVVEFFDMVAVAPDMRLEEIEVPPRSPLDGRSVGEAFADHTDVTILALKKPGAELVAAPGPAQRLSSGDLLIALGPLKVLSELAGKL